MELNIFLNIKTNTTCIHICVGMYKVIPFKLKIITDKQIWSLISGQCSMAKRKFSNLYKFFERLLAFI